MARNIGAELIARLKHMDDSLMPITPSESDSPQPVETTPGSASTPAEGTRQAGCIVSRLRAEVAWEAEVGELLTEAAGEIERLRGYRDLAEADRAVAMVAAERLRLTDAEREAVRFCGELCRLGERDDLAATLRGLLERTQPDRPKAINGAESDRPEPIATPNPLSTPAECTVPPQWTSRPYWVDPPEGWRWGFPRLYDPATDGDMRAWMVANGYPQRMADQGLACTFTAWTEDVKK